MDNKKTCEEQGGIWSIWSNIENPIKECNLPTSDGGKECTDSSQCESYCQAPEDSEIDSSVIGKCYEWKKTIVCMQEVRSGIADATWCY